jgi:sirohydrochlorin cobaltochelatase
MSPRGVILLGHGSRHPGLGRPFAGLQQWLQAELGPGHRVEDAYLSLCPPTLDQALETLYREGLRQVSVLPLFLVAGHHVSEELPLLMDAASRRFPDLQMSLSPHLGALGDIAPLLAIRLAQAVVRPACAAAPSAA